MAGDYLIVDGLKELQRSLRQMDKGLAKGMRLSLNESAEFLIGKARPKIPRLTGAAASSLKARSSGTLVRVAVGGRKAPYFPWLDFGGRTGRKKSVVRPFLKEGRYIYPTLRDNREAFSKILLNNIVEVAEGAGLDVS